jgi:hypothetical protein
MFTVIRKQTRPNKDIQFYIDKYPTSEEYNIYFYEKFIKTKKFISSHKQPLDDLVMLYTSTWSSHSAFLEFTSDEYCYINLIEPTNAYDRSNDIETIFSIIEE